MCVPDSIGRNINPSQAIGSEVIDLLVEEREATSHENALEALLMVDRKIDGHIGLAAFKGSLRIRERRAATPAPHRPCVARGGCMAIAEWACHVERVSICPADVALCFWKDKSVRYESARFEVEFTDHGSIGATPREDNKATAMIGRQGRAAVPDPVLSFVASKRIDIDQNVPSG